MKLTRTLIAVGASAALAIGASACGSSSKASSGSGSGAGSPIKVGLLCSCSGPFGTQILPGADTYKAWVNTVNAQGGIEGHQVQLTVDDDAGNPGTSTSDVQSLLTKVDAIVDMSIVDEAWAPSVTSSKVPMVGGNETETPFYTNPDFYPEGQTEDSTTYASVATAKEAQASNLGDLYCAEAPSCQEGVPLIKTVGKQLGVPVTYNGEISATAPNYTSQCLAAKQAHVSALFIGDSSPIIARVGQDCDQQGYDPTVVTEGEGFSPVLTSAPDLKDHLWSEFGTVPFFASIPAVQSMNAAVDKYYPGVRQNATAWSENAAEMWASGLLLEDALKGGGLTRSAAPTSALITKGLTSMKGDTLQGMAPPLTFAAGKPHPVDCWFVGRVQGGTPSVANDGHVSCQKQPASA